MTTRQGNRLAVWGGGGHGIVVAEAARAAGWTVESFIDARQLDDPTLHRRPEDEVLSLIAGTSALPADLDALALGIGRSRPRRRLLHLLNDHWLPPIIHPRAERSSSAEVGAASVVLAGAVINARAEIGRGVIVNSRAVVEHHCIVGEGAHIAPGAVLCGNVTIGSGTWVGAAAVVIQGIRIGANVVVGAGAVVLSDIPDGVTVVGNPARMTGLS